MIEEAKIIGMDDIDPSKFKMLESIVKSTGATPTQMSCVQVMMTVSQLKAAGQMSDEAFTVLGMSVAMIANSIDLTEKMADAIRAALDQMKEIILSKEQVQ